MFVVDANNNVYYLSKNGGSSWNTLTNTTMCNTIRISRQSSDGSLIVAATSGDIYISRNGGTTFTAVGLNPWTATYDGTIGMSDNGKYIYIGGYYSY